MTKQQLPTAHSLLEKMATFNREYVPEWILVRQLVHFYTADPGYGRNTSQKSGLEMGNFALTARTVNQNG